MKTVFALSAVMMSVQALTWSDITDFLYQFDYRGAIMQQTGMDLHEQPFYDFHQQRFTSRQDTNKKVKSKGNKGRRMKPLTEAQRHMYYDAHHNLMAQRARLGLPRVGYANSPEVGQAYDQLNSSAGFFLNFLRGMSYSKGSDSKCFSAAESFIIGLDTASDIMRKIYISAYWAELQVQQQDLIAITSALYVDCSVDKLFTVISHVISSEGQTELYARATGAFFFEIKEAQDAWNNPDKYSQKRRGEIYGRALSVLLNYTI